MRSSEACVDEQQGVLHVGFGCDTNGLTVPELILLSPGMVPPVTVAGRNLLHRCVTVDVTILLLGRYSGNSNCGVGQKQFQLSGSNATTT